MKPMGTAAPKLETSWNQAVSDPMFGPWDVFVFEEPSFSQVFLKELIPAGKNPALF